MPGHLRAAVAAADRADAGGGDELGARVGGRPGQRVGDRTHAADRHPPLAGPVADQVVEEAAVLHQGALVHRGERADHGVGRGHPPDGVVGEPRLDGRAEGRLDEVPPDVGSRPGRGSRARWGAGTAAWAPPRAPGRRPGRRTGATRRTPRCRRSAPRTSAASPHPRDARRAARRASRPAAPGCTTPSCATRARCPARGSSMSWFGMQRHQVGVARKPRGLAAERRRRNRGAPGVVETLEDEDRQALAGEVRRRHEPVVPATDHRPRRTASSPSPRAQPSGAPDFAGDAGRGDDVPGPDADGGVRSGQTAPTRRCLEGKLRRLGERLGPGGITGAEPSDWGE